MTEITRSKSPQADPCRLEGGRYTRFQLKMRPVVVVLCAIFALSLSLRHSISHASITVLFFVILCSGQLRWVTFPGRWAIIGLIAWQLLAECFGPHPGEMLQSGGITYHWLLIPLLVAAITSLDDWYRFVRWWSIGLFLAFILCVVQALVGLDTDKGPWRVSLSGEQFDRVTGFQFRPWIMSYLFALGIVVFLPLINEEHWWKSKYVRWGMVAACGIGLGLTQIRGTLLAVSVALPLFVWAKFGWKKALLVVLYGSGIGVIGVLLRPDMLSNFMTANGRTYIWSAVLRMIGDYPVWGVGREHFRDHYIPAWDMVNSHLNQQGLRTRIGHPHNDYLNLAVHYGVAALLCYLIYLGSMMVYYIRQIGTPHNSNALAGLSVIAFIVLAGITENYIDHTTCLYAAISACSLVWLKPQLQ